MTWGCLWVRVHLLLACFAVAAQKLKEKHSFANEHWDAQDSAEISSIVSNADSSSMISTADEYS